MRQFWPRSFLLFGTVSILWTLWLDPQFSRERLILGSLGIILIFAALADHFRKPALSKMLASFVAALYLLLVAPVMASHFLAGEWAELLKTISAAYSAPDFSTWGMLQKISFRVDLIFFQIAGTAYFIAMLVAFAFSLIKGIAHGIYAKLNA